METVRNGGTVAARLRLGGGGCRLPASWKRATKARSVARRVRSLPHSPTPSSRPGRGGGQLFRLLFRIGYSETQSVCCFLLLGADPTQPDAPALAHALPLRRPAHPAPPHPPAAWRICTKFPTSPTPPRWSAHVRSPLARGHHSRDRPPRISVNQGRSAQGLRLTRVHAIRVGRERRRCRRLSHHAPRSRRNQRMKRASRYSIACTIASSQRRRASSASSRSS